MKFGICNETFQGWKIDDIFTFCARAGYDAVEVAPYTLAKYVTDIPAAERARIRDAAARAGIAISGIHWVLAQAEGMHLTSPEAATRDRTAQYFCDLVDFCADIGGKIIVVGSPKQRNLLPGVTADQAWTWATDVFRPSVKAGEKRGVIICLEPLPAEDTNFINTAAEAVRFTRQLQSPNFKVILATLGLLPPPIKVRQGGDLRAFDRIPFEVPVQLATGDLPPLEARPINISLGGMLLTMDASLPVGSLCALTITPESRDLDGVSTEGAVIRSDGHGTAVRFSRPMGETALKAIKRPKSGG